ncbi:MAG: hypothetical protein AVDCRST_MAG02-858 [uncultured Rubrobacteraceae bacterium]|uniref:Uncharacterized protein n=1 Tax=uncultured Rubrobacteraceae bacterium TaxID=349277 RepID=A0A6J4QP45_9ACTN|nr:MAG: hypothetical protein AVDCRST_MAG02-858 [uncultured Rubrobacteraceae bacterium]
MCGGVGQVPGLAPGAVGAALDALTVRGCLLLSGALALVGGGMVLSRRAAGPASDPAPPDTGDRAAGWTNLAVNPATHRGS